MAGRVPDSVRLSVRKSNLAPFYYDSIAGPDMPAIRGVLDADRLEIGAYVQPEVVRRLVRNPPAANAPNWLAWMSHVWRLVTAESWLRYQSDPSALQEQESSLPRPEGPSIARTGSRPRRRGVKHEAEFPLFSYLLAAGHPVTFGIATRRQASTFGEGEGQQRWRTTETPEYIKPEVKDYGDLKELTATASTGTQTDVPKGTHVPPFSIFS